MDLNLCNVKLRRISICITPVYNNDTCSKCKCSFNKIYYTPCILTWGSILPASSDLSRAAPGPQDDERPSEERTRVG